MIEENKNPFEAMAEIYDEQVKEADEAGFADLFKSTTEKLFEAIKNECRDYHKVDINITNIEYLDGYFIFGYGTNSVVHFGVKETPGWKYGIWWSPIETKESTEEKPMYDFDHLRCQFFAQYEDEIDKFKPSASHISVDYNIYLPTHSEETLYIANIADHIVYICKEPKLAFYKEMHWVDYNTAYITRTKARCYWLKYKLTKIKDKFVSTYYTKKALRALYKVFKPAISEGVCKIVDQGNVVFPRYELLLINQWTDDLKNGCYGLADIYECLFNVDKEEADKVETKLDKLMMTYDVYASKIWRIWWHKPFHISVTVVSENYFKEVCSKDSDYMEVEFNKRGKLITKVNN